jgi:hypothetical protein
VKISVTQHDIDHGHARSVFSCPVALAVTRALGFEHAGRVTIGRGTSCIECAPGEIRIVSLPYSVHLFTRAFDNYELVEPFEFELSLHKGVAE